jgi:MSHA biogenesis protein MshL
VQWVCVRRRLCVGGPSTALRAGLQALAVASLAALPAGAAAQTRGRLPVLPLTQLDESAPAAALDNQTVTLTFAQPVPLREMLTLLVRGSAFGVVADPEIDGTFVGDLRNVTLRQALDQTLDPMGLTYGVTGNVVRVFRRAPQTRIFDINYIAAERSGTATIGGGEAGGTASVTTTAKSDVFADVAAGVRGLLSRNATFNVDRKAGLVQVTDFPDRLDRVAVYLDAVEDRVHRQAQIDIRVVEVELSDEKAAGIDWTAIAAQMRVSNDRGANAAPQSRPSLTGMRIMDANRLLTLLEAQGKLTVVAAPRVLTMNNEPAIVRSGAVTFSVTPQIADDALLTLSLSPIVAAPALAESDMLARVADGETLVVSGFTRDRETRERKAVGISGGWFGRATVVTRRRVELLVMLTPRIVPGMMAP